jgi:hypothetical protein
MKAALTPPHGPGERLVIQFPSNLIAIDLLGAAC